jgi:hypothetical protein
LKACPGPSDCQLLLALLPDTSPTLMLMVLVILLMSFLLLLLLLHITNMLMTSPVCLQV